MGEPDTPQPSPEEEEALAAQIDETFEEIDAEFPEPEDLEEGEGEAELDGGVDTIDPSPDYLDDLRRLQAEFENYKKQMVRRQGEHLERAAESIVTNLLPVLDAGDRAKAHGAAEAAGIAALLYETLRKEGLESLESEPGDAFDPNVHDAVAHEPADDEADADGAPAGAVLVEVLREGYRWKGRLLRPAMVRVKG
ncbi:MAG TPA: nucleotide exchange factor GrpE [Acidimicrobiales bacterium]|nr:nucleotide exchange factor GrpE [Acidimicrobiales bacterium]